MPRISALPMPVGVANCKGPASPIACIFAVSGFMYGVYN